MSKAPCGRMPCIWASLSVAATKLKGIDTDNEIANSLLFELETAVHLAEANDYGLEFHFLEQIEKKNERQGNNYLD